MSLRTFLVEDSQTILTSLTETLGELADVEVIGTADCESAAVEWLLQNPLHWRLSIIDLFLLNGSGLGVLSACHVREADQRVVVLSNYATSEMRRRCFACGADAVFDKSTEVDTLVQYCLAH